MKAIDNAVQLLDQKISQLTQVRQVLTSLNGYARTVQENSANAKARTKPAGKRKLTASAIAHIRKAQKARWAKWRKEHGGR